MCHEDYNLDEDICDWVPSLDSVDEIVNFPPFLEYEDPTELEF